MLNANVAQNFQIHRLPNPRIAIRYERNSVAVGLEIAVIAHVLPIQPVEPTVRQFDSIDLLNQPLRRHLHREHVALPFQNPFGRVDFVRHVHADYMLAVRKKMPVHPNLGAIIDSGKLEQIGIATRRRVERRAIPPILLVKILRHRVCHVFPKVQIGIHAVFLQDFQHRGRHAMNRIPIRILKIGL